MQRFAYLQAESPVAATAALAGNADAMEGENRYHAIFGNQTCASTHPSAAAVLLLAYKATLQIMSKDGKERTVALADFFLAPEKDVQHEHILAQGDVLTTITLPRLPQGTDSAYMNLKHKQSFDWPLVEAAVVLSMSGEKIRDARVVLGSVAPVPWRSVSAEKVLVGSSTSDKTALRAGKAATDGATPLTHNDYKVPLLTELVRRTVLKAMGRLPADEEVMAI